ncbi:tripartite tricarboxylate transporter TctB family protein, partial [Vibrio metschnikovii]|nr:tripartite tricarboxylate transporter TctB family protein [Vibrio metschnikovii]
LLYSFMFELIGFLISTMFFMLMMLMVTCGIKRWKQSLVIGVVFSVGIYFIFNELLSINLPSGTLFS